jgi:hypothetical protein
MKSNRLMFSAVVLMLVCTVTFAQSHSDMPKSPAPQSDVQKPPSDAQKSFDTLKTLAGNWEGPASVDPPQPEMDTNKPVHVSLRVTSRGNVLVHEMQEAGTPLDATRYDHPVTMLYLDGERLTLVHYCDAGNRPRMTAKVSPDGKKVEFEFLDLSGGNEYGHMYHAVFTIVDANHHIEDWTYMMPGDKPVHAHLDLKRGQ